jgi:hypothetical protein
LSYFGYASVHESAEEFDENKRHCRNVYGWSHVYNGTTYTCGERNLDVDFCHARHLNDSLYTTEPKFGLYYDESCCDCDKGGYIQISNVTELPYNILEVFGIVFL